MSDNRSHASGHIKDDEEAPIEILEDDDDEMQDERAIADDDDPNLLDGQDPTKTEEDDLSDGCD